MSQDYSKLKVTELQSLLKERSLAHTGKKDELLTRLAVDDKSKANAQKPAPIEDEIDWDEEEGTTQPSTNAMKAGGQGQIPNPVAVPNQTQAIDPAETGDLTVSVPDNVTPAPTTIDTTTSTDAAPTVPSTTTAATTTTTTATEQPKKDFTLGMAATDLEAELQKRKARAAKFGLPAESQEDAIKAIERAKRFGNSGPATTPNVVKGLDEALPVRSDTRGRKRGSEGPAEGDNARRGGRGGARGARRGGAGAAAGGPRGGNDGGVPANTKSKDGMPTWMSDADRKAAAARKAKWSATAA